MEYRAVLSWSEGTGILAEQIFPTEKKMTEVEGRPIYLKISPNFDFRKLYHPTLDDYIDIFEDRVQGWIIDSAHILNQHEHGGWSVLQVIVAYFELIAIFMQGKDSNKQSKKFFRLGFLSVFSEIDDNFNDEDKDIIIDIMYHELRCGLYHTGLPKPKIWLYDNPCPLLISKAFADDSSLFISDIRIDRNKFVERIEGHFRHYVEQLRDPSNTVLRANFEVSFTRLYI